MRHLSIYLGGGGGADEGQQTKWILLKWHGTKNEKIIR
jgi:hypothetical protein